MGHGAAVSSLTSSENQCFSPDPAGNQVNQVNQVAEAQSSVSGPGLEEPALVLGAGEAAHCSPMAHSPETRPLSGKRNDLAPPA